MKWVSQEKCHHSISPPNRRFWHYDGAHNLEHERSTQTERPRAKRLHSARVTACPKHCGKLGQQLGHGIDACNAVVKGHENVPRMPVAPATRVLSLKSRSPPPAIKILKTTHRHQTDKTEEQDFSRALPSVPRPAIRSTFSPMFLTVFPHLGRAKKKL